MQEKIKFQLSLIRSTDKLAMFFNAVNNMIDTKQVLVGREMLIEQPKSVTGKDSHGDKKTFAFEPGTHVLFLRLSSVYSIYDRSGYNSENTTLSTLEQNLRSHPSYIGTVPSRRFTWEETVEVAKQDDQETMIRVRKERSTSTSAIIIDYDKFMEMYNIDFRRGDIPARIPLRALQKRMGSLILILIPRNISLAAFRLTRLMQERWRKAVLEGRLFIPYNRYIIPQFNDTKIQKIFEKIKRKSIYFELISHISAHANPEGERGHFSYIREASRCEKSPVPPNFTKITGKSDVLKMFFRKTPSYNPTILQMNFFSNYYYLLYILLSVSYVVFAVFSVL